MAKNMGHQSGSSQVQKNKGQVGTVESMQFDGSFDFHGFMSQNPSMVAGRSIYLHERLIFYGFHVGKYTSPMDCLGVFT